MEKNELGEKAQHIWKTTKQKTEKKDMNQTDNIQKRQEDIEVNEKKIGGWSGAKGVEFLTLIHPVLCWGSEGLPNRLAD